MRICEWPGCEKKYKANGFCSTHYQRNREDKDMNAPIQIRDGNQGCKYPGCDNKHHANGYCGMHCKRDKDNSDMNAPKRIVDPDRGCKHPGCEEKHNANGFCRNHDPITQESMQASNHRRIAQKLDLPFDIGITREKLRKICGDDCCYCELSMDFEVSRKSDSAEIDHIKPYQAKNPEERGGNTWDNVTLACRKCNNAKKNKILYRDWFPVKSVRGGRKI